MNKPEHHYRNVDGRVYMKPAKNRRVKKSLAEMNHAVKENKAALQQMYDSADELERSGFFGKLGAMFVRAVYIPITERLVRASEEMYRGCKNQVKSQYIISK